jgi:Emfourin
MKVTIKTSGGFGGFGLSPKPTVVDVDLLVGALKERVRAAFAPARLKTLAKAAGDLRAADRIVYELEVTAEGGRTERVEVNEDALPAEMLDLIDEIRSSEG